MSHVLYRQQCLNNSSCYIWEYSSPPTPTPKAFARALLYPCRNLSRFGQGARFQEEDFLAVLLKTEAGTLQDEALEPVTLEFMGVLLERD